MELTDIQFNDICKNAVKKAFYIADDEPDLSVQFICHHKDKYFGLPIMSALVFDLDDLNIVYHVSYSLDGSKIQVDKYCERHVKVVDYIDGDKE